MHIGAYIMVFMEKDELGWETRLAEYDAKYSPENPNISPHIFILEKILELYMPLIEKIIISMEILDEDLKQYLMIHIALQIRKFPL